MILITQWEAIALIVIIIVGFIGLLMMATANDRRIRLLRILSEEHDARLRRLEMNAGFTNWTSDLEE